MCTRPGQKRKMCTRPSRPAIRAENTGGSGWPSGLPQHPDTHRKEAVALRRETMGRGGERHANKGQGKGKGLRTGVAHSAPHADGARGGWGGLPLPLGIRMAGSPSRQAG